MDDKFDIARTEVNFIYSCMPAVNNSIVDFEWFIQNFTEEPGLNSFQIDNLHFFQNRPDERIGISQYLALKQNSGYVKLDPIRNCRLQINREKFKDSEEKDYETDKKIFEFFLEAGKENVFPKSYIELTIFPLIRIFPKGTSITLKVEAKCEKGKFMTHHDVHQILHLIGINKNKSGNYLIEIPKNSPFFDQIDNDDRFYVGESHKKITLYRMFEVLLKDIFLKKINDSLAKKNKLQLKLLCSELLKHPGNNTDFDSQSPWVVTNLLLNKDSYEKFIVDYNEVNELGVKKKNREEEYEPNTFSFPAEQKSKALRHLHNIITPLVFRVPDLNLDDFMYEEAYSQWAEWGSNILDFYNLYLDRRLFLQISRRSILTLRERHEEEPIERYPATYYLPGLLDLSEMVRARWQTLVILNHMMDESIRKVRDSEESLSSNDLRAVFEKIAQASSCLEDPSNSVVSGDSLREVKERLVDTFNIRVLVKVVLKKIDLFEKLYRYKTEIALKEATYGYR